MLTLPETYYTLISKFTRIFSNRVWCHAQILLPGAILAPGKRTVTSVLRVMGLSDEQHFQNYHRVLSRAVWTRVYVKAGGRTSTDVTAPKIYVYVDHFYRTPGHAWHGVSSNWKQKENATTTGKCWTSPTLFANGFEHAAQADHQAKVSGEWSILNDQWGPQRIIP